MATLKDVAQAASVDMSTASRVLRGDPRQAVSAATRERILEAARVLQYRPNALARSLRMGRTDTIGLIIPSLDNVGFTDVTHGVQAAAARAGKLVLVVEAGALPDGAGQRLEHYSRLASDGRVDGIIAAFASLDDRLLKEIAERGLPLVLVNRRTTGVQGSVVVDDKAGSRLAVEHLISLGHRRIAFVGLSPETDTARRRELGYSRAMEAGGLAVDPSWRVAGAPTEAGGREGAAALLALPESRRPTAIFAASLLAAIGVLAGLHDGGVEVPAEVSLIAFNDHPIAAHLSPPLTTIRMANFEMGEAAVEMLLRAIEGGGVDDVMLTDKPQLIVRSSTAPPSTR